MAVTQVLGTDKALRLNNFDTLGLVQNFNWSPNFNAQDVFELGRTTRLDTLMELETSGSFDVTAAGNLAGLIARMKVKLNSGTGAFEGFHFNETAGAQVATAWSGVASGTSLGINGYDWNQDDLANLKFDLVLHEKTEQTLFNRSTYLACCYPTTINGRVDANGVATDTVNWSGLYVVGFPSPYHDVRTVPAVRGSAANKLALIDGAAYTTGWTVAYVTMDGVPITTDTQNPTYVSSSFTSSELTVTGATVPVGVVTMVTLYKTSSPNTNWANVHTPDTVGSGATAVFGVRGFQANVYIAPSTSTAAVPDSQWLKVQSLDYSVDMRMETMRQIAFNDQGTSIYHRAPTYPLAMTVNATVMETDWADWKALITGKAFDGTGTVYNNTYDFAPQNLKKEFAVVVDYFTKDGTKIQRVTFGDMRVDGMGSRIAVGGRGEITWTFRGSSFRVQGTNIA